MRSSRLVMRPRRRPPDLRRPPGLPVATLWWIGSSEVEIEPCRMEYGRVPAATPVPARNQTPSTWTWPQLPHVLFRMGLPALGSERADRHHLARHSPYVAPYVRTALRFCCCGVALSGAAGAELARLAKSTSVIPGTAIRTPRLIAIPARAFPGKLLRLPDAVTSCSIHPSLDGLLGRRQEVFITNSRSHHRFERRALAFVYSLGASA